MGRVAECVCSLEGIENTSLTAVAVEFDPNLLTVGRFGVRLLTLTRDQEPSSTVQPSSPSAKSYVRFRSAVTNLKKTVVAMTPIKVAGHLAAALCMSVLKMAWNVSGRTLGE